MSTRSNGQASTDGISHLLGSVRSKGVRIWSDNGQLRYEAPKGALTQTEFDRLRASRGQIVTLLERTASAEAGGPEFAPLDRVPLAFSQLAHWHFFRLRERHAIRQLASATRLGGSLNVAALRKALAEMVCRHDALRTRIVVCDGIPAQEIAKSGDCELTVRDLTAVPENLHEAEVHRLIEQFILEPIDLAVGPLFGVQLLKLRDDVHVLIVVMEHIIADMYSLRILLRELFAAYAQTMKGRPFSLPAISVKFGDYALRQRNSEESWIEKHGAYWKTVLAGFQRLRFPEDKNLQITARSGWGIVYLKVGRDLKAELREWSRQRRTTIVMSVLTAYVGLVLRWCNASEAIIQYQTDGRTRANMANTIGYFASALSLGIAIGENDSFLDLLKRVTETYCEAYEHADFSYLVAQESRPEFARSTGFNWIPVRSGADISELSELEYPIACRQVDFAHPLAKNIEVDGEPSITIFDTEEDETTGEVWFPRSRFSPETMERFGRNFVVFIKALLRQANEPVKGIELL
jgi:hypothetical protein